MDCFNHSCPFRVNQSSSLHRCECVACPNRDSGIYTIAWDKTLTKEEMDEIKRKLDPMNNEELVKHFKGILTGSASEQDTQNFTQMLIQIAKEGYGEREPNPIYEALETLDDFLEELDEFYGLAALKYGSEAYSALEVLHFWYNEQNEQKERTLTWLERLELEKAMMGRGVDYETAEQILIDFQKRMDRF